MCNWHENENESELLEIHMEIEFNDNLIKRWSIVFSVIESFDDWDVK